MHKLQIICLIAALVMGSPSAELSAQLQSELRVGISVGNSSAEQQLGELQSVKQGWDWLFGPFPDYRLEGGFVTGLPAFIAGYALTRNGFDGTERGIVQGIIVGLFTGAIFSIPGAALGGMFPKGPLGPDPETGALLLLPLPYNSPGLERVEAELRPDLVDRLRD